MRGPAISRGKSPRRRAAPASFVHPAEASHGGGLGMVQNGELCVSAISWSRDRRARRNHHQSATAFRSRSPPTGARWARRTTSPRAPAGAGGLSARAFKCRPPGPAVTEYWATRWRSPCSEAEGFTARDFGVFTPARRPRLGSLVRDVMHQRAVRAPPPRPGCRRRWSRFPPRALQLLRWPRSATHGDSIVTNDQRPAPAHECRPDGCAGDRGDDPSAAHHRARRAGRRGHSK